MKTNIIEFKPYIDKKFLEIRLEAYSKVIKSMTKVELLEEMERFINNNSKKGADFLHRENVLRGLVLYKELNKQAESDELLVMTRNYITYLNSCLLKFEGKENVVSNDAS